MDALVCLRPGVLQFQNMESLERPSGWIAVRIRRIGICGTDFHIFEGKHPFLNYPRVMGHELSGEILETEADSEFAVGDQVVVNPYLSCGACKACRSGKPNCCLRIEVLGVHRDGGMSEVIFVPPENLISANGLSLDACATVEFLSVGAHAVRRGAIRPGEQVLVVGTGPIGIGTALSASLAGGEVSLLDKDSGRLTEAGALIGARHTIHVSDGVAERIADITDGSGFDAVFDATGNQQSMQAGFTHVAHGGRYVLVSVIDGNISFSDPEFHKREMTLIGSRNALRADFETVMVQIEEGRIAFDDLITHRTSLRGAAIDLPRWAADKSNLIKAMIELD